jgi:predicted MPP superfamily phosphohydrolase
MVLSRRACLKSAFAAGIGLAAGGSAYSYACRRAPILLTHVTVPVAGLPAPLAGLRIGMISDVHRSRWVSADDVHAAVTLLKSGRPDLVVLVGDYVTWGDRAFIGPAAEALSTLSAPHGVFAVLGNHDDDRDMPAALETLGIAVLKDRRTQLTIGGAPLDLVGIRFWTRRASDIRPLLKGASKTIVLLAHDPRRFAEAQALRIPLVLSGHTHGGQVVLPVIGAVAARKFPVVSGSATARGTTIFVSRGVGTVYVPVRVNCPPEVAILTLEPARSAPAT